MDELNKAKLFYEIGDLYFSTQRDSSIFYLTKSYHLANEFGDPAFRGDVIALLGMAYQVVDLEKSAEYLFEGLTLVEEQGDKSSIAYYNILISTHYRIVGDLEIATDYAEKSLNSYYELNDSAWIAGCYNNLGIIHMLKAEYDTGLEFWMKSLDLKLLINDTIGAANTMSNIGIYYEDIGRTEEALDFFNSSLRLELSLNLLDRASHSYQYLGDLHFSTSDYSRAIKSYEKAIDMMDSTGILFDKLEPLLEMSKAYDSLNNYTKAYHVLREYQELYKVYRDSSRSIATQELAAKYESEKKEKENALLKSANDAKDARIEEEKAKTALKDANNRYLLIGLGLVGIILVLIAIALNRMRKSKLEIETQKLVVDQSHKEIRDSISYAKRLQTAILPTTNAINAALPPNFILYLPKDIVAGDFYWMEPYGDKILFAVADCTGHGVPGAFVSIVCHNALNRAVREFKLVQPSRILDKVTDLVIETFAQSDEDVKDGMDIALISLDINTQMLRFAGANNNLYVVSNGRIKILKADRQPIGKYVVSNDFSVQEIQLKTGDTFYMFTDGYIDQFGGPNEKKFKTQRFLDLLLEIQDMSMRNQKVHLEKVFNEWKGDLEQVDDVCILGVRI